MTGARSSKDTAVITIGDREIMVAAPTDDQLVVLAGLIDKLAGGDSEASRAARVEGIQLYGDFCESLMVDPADRSWCTRQVMGRKLPPGTFADMLTKVIEAFKIQLEAAPVNRSERRSRASRTRS